MYTVADLLTANATRTPEHTAVIDGQTRVSYGELYDRARRCASLFTRRTNPGDRVAVLLPRGTDALAVYFGAHLAAAVPVFVHDQLRARQVARIVRHAGARMVCTATSYRGVLRDLELPEDAVVDVATVRESPLAMPAPRIGRDIAALIYTSGSTGTAKGVVVTHDNLVAGATIVRDYLRLNEHDRTLAILPWSFDYGLNQVLATFAAGGTVVVQRSSFCPDICRTLAAAQVTGLAGVPSLWAALTGLGSPFGHMPLPTLRYITNSGGPLAPATIERIRTAQPHLDVYLMYGLTEAFRSTYLDPALIDIRPTSIGKAIPNTEIIVIGDDGRSCPPGVVGELVHRGPTVALGYWQDPRTTAAVFRSHPQASAGVAAETVVYSGDYVRADIEGYLYYVGRRDELFKSRGVRVTTTEIETEIRASGMVTEAVVAAVTANGPDPWLAAAVVLNTGGATLDDLRAYCREELAPHLQPHEIVAMQSMPTTPTGKIARTTVRAQLTELATAKAPS
jgi:acyl-CoA synthetase (AMP-forming)/AMP-acid ligase II